MKNKYTLLWIGILAVVISACSVSYTFSGTDVGDAQTISIAYFPNRSQLAPPTYSQQLTEDLKDIFLRQTKLDIVVANGDLQISGEVTGYNSRPQAITGDNTASQNRLSITVKVKFVNKLDKEQNFEKTFTRYEDYDATTQLSQAEEQLIPVINEQLTQDILQDAIGNW